MVACWNWRRLGCAVDDDEVGVRIFLTNGLRGLIFGTSIAGHSSLAVGECDHDIAVACASFHRLKRATPHDEAGIELFECRPRSGEIIGITFLIAHRYADDPISLRHEFLPRVCFEQRLPSAA